MSVPLKSSKTLKSTKKLLIDSTTQSEHIHSEFTPTLSSGAHSVKIGKSQCKHASHQHLKLAAFSKLLPAEHWAAHGLQQIDEMTEDSLDADQAHRAINEAFIKRLQEVELKAPNALEVKLDTYKDWVSVLQRLNNVLLNDFDDLEKTIEQHLHIHESRSNFSYRRDVATLVRFIRQAYHDNNWSFAGMKFETITPAEILGLNENDQGDKEILADLLKEKHSPRQSKNSAPKKESLHDSVKALADEVARKHDDNRKLKEEISHLEEEIKKAQMKIHLKDEVIRELKTPTANNNKSTSLEIACNINCSSEMTPTNMEIVSDGKHKEPKSAALKTPNDKMKVLHDRLHEILNSSVWRTESSVKETSHLKELFMKLDSDRIEAYNRLNYIRDELLHTLGPQCQVNHHLSLQLNDEMIIQALRDHIDNICATKNELSKRVKELIIEKGEMYGKLECLIKTNKCQERALKEIADILTPMTGENYKYEDIYDPNKLINPFCQAICRLRTKSSIDFAELKTQLDEEKTNLATKEIELLKLQQVNEETRNCTQHSLNK